jgi:hypothetical protein
MASAKSAAKIAAALFFAVTPARAGVDALAAQVDTEDADRFVALFESANGAPDGAALQAAYIDPGTDGLKIFTPGRIENGENLARAIAEHPDHYRRAIDVCLPIARASSAELRAVYLALEGLLGDPDLPEIYALFGAGNSGGTAGPGAQVIGLEVICRDAGSDDEIKSLLRSFYAHETVHTFQAPGDKVVSGADALTVSVIQEGTADYVAALVTGRPISPERAAWAEPRAAEIWKAFEKDRRAMKKLTPEKQYAKGSPLFRWVANIGSPPEGWPGELGYWLGMEIAAAYVDGAPDKRTAIKELISMTDPDAILEQSGYAAKVK